MIEALTEDINISLAYRTIENLYGKNVFLIDEPEIAQSLKKNQRNIKEIRIDRLYPNGLKILLSGYPILFDITFPEDTKQWWGITENGIIIPKDQIKTPVKKKIIFYGDTLGEGTLLEYKEIISEKRIKTIEKTLLFLEENYPDFKIEKIYYLEKENEFHIVGKNNTHLLLALQDITEKNTQKPLYKNLRASLLSLKAFIEDRKVDFIAGQYIYIDARIPGKIFFCKNTSICLSNLKLVYGDEYK